LIDVHLVPPSPVAAGHDHALDDFRLLVRSAETGGAEFRLAVSAEVAQVILFVGSRDSLHRDVRRHALARRFPERVVLYDSSDRVVPFLRGIYPSACRSWYVPRRMRSGHYLRWSDRDSIRYTDPATAPTHLFGFRGAVTHPIRRALLALGHDGALLADTTEESGRGFGQSDEVYRDYRERYGEELAAVRFVVCPRGAGPGSMRIFEAMKAGRAPVVVSDEWVEPEGPDWASFSLRLAERDVEQLPLLLERRAGEAAEMGRRARQAWERWFSPEASFATLSGWASELVAGSWRRERIDRLLVRRRLLAPRLLFRHLIGPRTGRQGRPN
jgi:hypothetical protein